ncbi:MAG: hypothetical protein RBR69_07510 [Candidatus Cloacimonadaceae bacterium]|nr:hypothetical protein [Candidatus Cloacimonadaceae bacterium]
MDTLTIEFCPSFRTVFGPSGNVGVYSIIMLAPTWDGSKVYFFVDISTN